MRRSPVLVSRTRRQWRAAARVLRTHRPELAAKITLARLGDVTAEMDDALTIAFTEAEYERLVSEAAKRQGQVLAMGEIAATIADVEAYLALSSTRAQTRREGS